MQSVAARVNSFAPPSPPKSTRTRRAATPKLSWPHPDNFLANPVSLAEAGFYHFPSDDDQDNVICFMCDKQLSEWEPDDDPLKIHIEKCPTCPWVMVKCQILYYKDAKTIPSSSLMPNSPQMVKARLETFGRDKQRWWPHDQVKNHGALSKHMAKAGFVYTPAFDPEDDTATCFYCGTILSGWEISDNPLEEHARRRVALACRFILSTKSDSVLPRNKASKSVVQEVAETGNENSAKSKTLKKKRRKKTDVPVTMQLEEQAEAAPKRSTRHQSKVTAQSDGDAPVQGLAEIQSRGDLTKSVAPKSKKKKKKEKTESPPYHPVEPEGRTTVPPQHENSSKAEISGLHKADKTTERETSESRLQTEPILAPLRPESVNTDFVLENCTGQEEKSIVNEEIPVNIPDPSPARVIQTPSRSPNAMSPLKTGFDIVPENPYADEERSVDLTDIEERFPLLKTPRPLMDRRRVQIPRLSSEERSMSVEEWIRAEMQKQYDILKQDGEMAIQAFQLHAQEIRQRIVAL